MAGKKEFRITTPRGSVFTVTGKNGSTTARLEWAPGFAQKKAEGFSRAQAFVDSECLRYMNPLTPRRTGMLIKSGTLGTVVGSGSIEYLAPYARRQYYEHKTKARWFETMKATFTVDTVPPTLQITAPSNDLITNKKTVTVSGKTDDVSSKPVTVTVNGATVTVGTDGTFTKDVTLAEGANTITIVAKDKAGKTTTVTRKVTVDTSAPVIKSVTLTPNPVDCGKTFIIAVEITD